MFVPLAGVLVVAYWLVPRGALGHLRHRARPRPLLLLPWAAGFVAYQLTLPTFFTGAGAGLDDLVGRAAGRPGHLARPTGCRPRWSRCTVATLLTAPSLSPPAARR